MEVEKTNVRGNGGHCNFCNSGKLNKTGYGLAYPYDFVYEFARSGGNGLKASICEDCLMELNIKVTTINDNE